MTDLATLVNPQVLTPKGAATVTKPAYAGYMLVGVAAGNRTERTLQLWGTLQIIGSLGQRVTTAI